MEYPVVLFDMQDGSSRHLDCYIQPLGRYGLVCFVHAFATASRLVIRGGYWDTPAR